MHIASCECFQISRQRATQLLEKHIKSFGHTMPLPPKPNLADIRTEIDRLDAAMHQLLIERSEVIETLITVKKTSDSGSAFRPAREAEVLRRLVERHRGLLPLDTVESIWRVIISTFTYVQAPHAVHADVTGSEAAIRDSARFHFGFTVPFITHDSALDVIKAVDRSKGDLGMFRLDQSADAGPWWRDLEGLDRPKIIARLPFIDRPDHPAGLPVYVISKPLSDAAVREVVIASLTVERWKPDAQRKLEQMGMKVVMTGGTHAALSVLTAHPQTLTPKFITAALIDSGCGDVRYHEIGGHTASFSAKA
jgi:chorismate mutase